MKNKLTFNTYERKVLDSIEKSGGKVYIVGGVVRDLLILDNIVQHDIDVEVYNLTIEELQTVLSTFGTVDEIGKSFGILKLSTLPDFDFSLPREEKKIGNTHRSFEITIDRNLDSKNASLRRDLTMNALLYDYRTNEIIDHFNGIEDIKNKCIRMVNQNTFKEDPLRVLRVARFASTYQFDIEDKTSLFCKEMAEQGLLDSLSSERVYEEYCKILLSKVPSIGFKFLNKINALPQYLSILQQTNQRLDYHPEGNVWNHSLLVLDLAALVKHRASNPLGFMWGALFHDLGKAIVTTKEGSAPMHNDAGVKVFEQYCTTLITNKKLQQYIKTIISYHMHLMNMVRRNAEDAAYYKVLKGIDGIMPIEDLVLISKCDKLGRLRDSHQDILKLDDYINDKIQRLGTKALVPVVCGKDLIDLGFKQSSLFKKILDEAYLLQLKGKNKEEIIKIIKEKY